MMRRKQKVSMTRRSRTHWREAPLLPFFLLLFCRLFVRADVEGPSLAQVPAIRNRAPFRTPTSLPSLEGVGDRGLSLVISTIDGGVHTLDAWTGQSKGLFFSGPPLYSSSFFLGGGANVENGARVNAARNKYFVMPTLEGRIVCVREDGTQEVLASNVLDLVDNPVMSCPDREKDPEKCGLLLGEKTTKLFALDGQSGNVKWMNSKFKMGGGAAGGGGAGGSTTTTFPASGGGKEDPPILLQRDDYVIRSLNVHNGQEEWNVTLSEIFAIATSDPQASRYLDSSSSNKDSEEEEEEQELPILPDIEWLNERTIRVSHPDSHGVLWERDLPSAPLGLYTVIDNKWLHLELPQQHHHHHPRGGSERGGSGAPASTSSRLLGLSGEGGGARVVGNQLWGGGGPLVHARAGRRGLLGSRLPYPQLTAGGEITGAGETENRQIVPSDGDSLALQKMRDLGLLKTTTNRHLSSSECTAWEIAHGRCGTYLPYWGREDNNPSDEEFCAPGDEGKSVNKFTTSGMFLTFETLATLVIAVFIIGIGFVLMVYQYQPGLVNRGGVGGAAGPADSQSAMEELMNSSRMLFEELMMKHNNNLRRSENSSTGTTSSSPDSISPTNTALTESSSSPVHRVANHRNPAASPLVTPQENRLRGSPVRSSSSGAPDLLPRSHSLPSLNPEDSPVKSSQPSPQQQQVPGGISIGSTESMEGRPIKRLQAMYGESVDRGESPSSSLKPPPSLTASRSVTTGIATMNGQLGGATTTSDGGSIVTEQLAAGSGSAPSSSVATTTTSAAAVTSSSSKSNMEVIHDSNGNPILFLSSSRYKNEFNENCKLGKGGFGTVFKSTNKLDGHDYAIKKIRLSSGSHWSNQLEKVLREVKILALLDHPNIIRYYQAWLERLSEEELATAIVNATTARGGGGNFGDCTFSDFHEESSSVHLINTNSGLAPSSPTPIRRGSRAAASTTPVRPPRSPLIECGSPLTADGNSEHEEDADSSWNASSGTSRPARRQGNRLRGFDEQSRISQWSEEDDDEEEDEEELRRMSEAEVKSDEDSGQAIVWSRSLEDVSSRPSTPGTPRALRPPPSPSSSSPGLWHRGSSIPSSSRSTNMAWPLFGGRRRRRRGAGGRQGGGMGAAAYHNQQREATVYDLCLYIQMQYCSNRTLKDFLELPERQKHVDKAQALQLAIQVVRGVKYVHERGLIHRDLKPTNCFLVGDGNTIKVGDFGLSRHVGPQGVDPSPADVIPSLPGPVLSSRVDMDYDNTAGVGTPVYGSPEQLSGGDYDEKTDIFSLGVMIFELFHPSFRTGMERMLTMRKIHEGHLPEDWATGNHELVDVVHRMLNRLPSHRPTAADVVAKLEFLQGKPLVLPLEYDQLPRDAVLLRAETDERDSMVQEVMNTIKKHGGGNQGLMKQYGFRSSSDGRAVIEVLLGGPQPGEIESIVKNLRELSFVVQTVGKTGGAAATRTTTKTSNENNKEEEEEEGAGESLHSTAVVSTQPGKAEG